MILTRVAWVGGSAPTASAFCYLFAGRSVTVVCPVGMLRMLVRHLILGMINLPYPLNRHQLLCYRWWWTTWLGVR